MALNQTRSEKVLGGMLGGGPIAAFMIAKFGFGASDYRFLVFYAIAVVAYFASR